MTTAPPACTGQSQRLADCLSDVQRACRAASLEKLQIAATRISDTDLQLACSSLDRNGWASCHYACARGNVRLVRYLVSKVGVDPDIRTASRQSTGLMLAARRGHMGVVSCLLDDLEASVNATDAREMSAFHFACYYGNATVAAALSRRGCETHSRTAEGRCALVLACTGRCTGSNNGTSGTCGGIEPPKEQRQVEVVRFLVKHCKHDPAMSCQVRGEQPLPLQLAARRGWLRMVKFLAEHSSAGRLLESIAAAKATALHLGHYDVVHLLEKLDSTPGDVRQLLVRQQLLAWASVSHGRLCHQSYNLSLDIVRCVARHIPCSGAPARFEVTWRADRERVRLWRVHNALLVLHSASSRERQWAARFCRQSRSEERSNYLDRMWHRASGIAPEKKPFERGVDSPRFSLRSGGKQSLVQSCKSGASKSRAKRRRPNN